MSRLFSIALSITAALFLVLFGLSGTTGKAAAASVDQLVKKCSDCHGTDGVSTHGEIPTIAGMSATFISNNLHYYKDKERPCKEVKIPGHPDQPASDMCKVTANFSDQDMDAIGKYFEGKKFVPANQPFDAKKAAFGKKVYGRYCEKCHADGGSDPLDDAGFLAGQWTQYLHNAFAEFDAHKRPMDKKMKVKYELLTKDEKEALLNYFAGYYASKK